MNNKFIYWFLQKIAITLGLTVLIFGVHYWLEDWFPLGADGWFMHELIDKNPFPIYYRSILTVIIHKFIYLLGAPLGLHSWYAISLSSSLAGALAIQVLWAFHASWLFLAINCLAGSFLVFYGHVENYAWVNLFLFISWWYTREWLAGRQPLWKVSLYYVLSCLSHMLAIFYLPAFIYLIWKHRRFHPYEILLPVIGFSMLLTLLGLFFPLLGTDNSLQRFVPWFEVWAENQFFTLFSLQHLHILAYFHWRASFLGMPLELPLLFWLRQRLDTLFLKFMLICVFCGLAWTTLWHPDWGFNDWDLFSQFGIPLHLLLGLLLTKK